MVHAVLANQEHGIEFFQLSGQSKIGIAELSTFLIQRGKKKKGTRQPNIAYS